jgi:hypothetical protein
MNIAIIQNPDGSTSLIEEITEATFPSIVYRPAEAGASIVEEQGTYVEIGLDASRKVLFPVRA